MPNPNDANLLGIWDLDLGFGIWSLGFGICSVVPVIVVRRRVRIRHRRGSDIDVDTAHHRRVNRAVEGRGRGRQRHRRARRARRHVAEVGSVIEHDVVKHGVVVGEDNLIAHARHRRIGHERARPERTDDADDHRHRRRRRGRRLGGRRRRLGEGPQPAAAWRGQRVHGARGRRDRAAAATPHRHGTGHDESRECDAGAHAVGLSNRGTRANLRKIAALRARSVTGGVSPYGSHYSSPRHPRGDNIRPASPKPSVQPEKGTVVMRHFTLISLVTAGLLVPAMAHAQATRFEVTSLRGVRPILAKTVADLQKKDVAAAKRDMEDYDNAWNGVEVYVNTRSKEMYDDIEHNWQTKVTDALNKPNADATAILADAKSMLAAYDKMLRSEEHTSELQSRFGISYA